MALIVRYRDPAGSPSVLTLPDGEPRRRTLTLGSTTRHTAVEMALVVDREIAQRIGGEVLLDERVIGGEEGGSGG